MDVFSDEDLWSSADVEKIATEAIREKNISIQTICLMACGLGGLQVVWSTIFSNGTLYLLALGVPATWTSIVWAVPATCGCFVQPVVGAYSDMLSHPWGRRRPFMIAGAIGVSISIGLLAWAGDFGHFTAAFLFNDSNLHTAQAASVVYAIFSICTLSLAIQPLQCALRAMMLDQCPSAQQAQAQCWATRFTGVGQIVGCLAGLASFPGTSSLGEVATFRILAVVSILSVDTSVLLTCVGIREAPTTAREEVEKANDLTTLRVFRGLLSSIANTPAAVRGILYLQVLAWMGWFSFLFYNTSYINQLYAWRNPDDAGSASGFIGSLVTLLFSCVSFITTIVLPEILQRNPRFSLKANTMKQIDRVPLSASPAYLLLWSSALGFSALLMFLTAVTTNFWVTTFLITLNGVSWAIATWLPFALIGELTASDAGTDNCAGGSITGIHNVAISAPQILAAGICSVVLRFAGQAGSLFSSGWVLRAGGIAFLTASCLAYKLAKAEFL